MQLIYSFVRIIEATATTVKGRKLITTKFLKVAAIIKQLL